ncbi:MAG TPA: protein kinase [Kineosporiaceae bacterium]|nr:protein kinase [Kineosporiaceae bacterium]
MEERRLGSRYVLTERLGRGAMGQVYRARVEPDAVDQGAEPTGEATGVAVKLLRDDLGADPDLIHRFLQEGRLLKSVDHPNVVRIRDLVAEGDQLAIVMDLVQDGDLRRAVPMPCPEGQAAQIVAGISAGLAAVHAAGIIHRDLKPENVLIERTEDGRARPRIGDFGVSRFDSATTTQTKGMTGTVGYLAPEIAQGRPATPASDVYSLGVILYELCVGHGPFKADHPIALIRAHAQDPVPRPPAMSQPMWELVEALLGKEPRGRPTADQAVQRLRRLGLSVSPAQDTIPVGLFLLRPWSEQRTPGAARTPAQPVAPATISGDSAAPPTISESAPVVAAEPMVPTLPAVHADPVAPTDPVVTGGSA